MTVTAVTPDVIPVQIDVRPHKINLRGSSRITVTLFGSAMFDVTQVNMDTLFFAGAAPAARVRVRDVDRDGHLDLLLAFRAKHTDLVDAYLALRADDLKDGKLDQDIYALDAALSGDLPDGTSFEGTDTIKLVPTISCFRAVWPVIGRSHRRG